MNKRVMMTFSVILLLIFIAGCTVGTGTKVRQKETDIGETIYTGTNGITMNFIKNNPPKIIYTTTPLNIIIEMKNEGAYDVAGGRLYITGIDPNIIDLDYDYDTFYIEGKSRYNPSGSIDTLAYSSRAIYLPKGTDVYKPTILASACYEYKTQASPLVCIDSNPYSVLEKEACEIKDITMSGGQGGPVAVTRIEEEAIPGRVNFIIHIQNAGGGVVIDKSFYSLNKCPGGLQYNDLDTVEYTVELSGESGNCKPSEKVKLVDGKGTIYCSFEGLPDEPAYQSILNIELSYGYLTQVSQQIEIRSIS